MGRRCVFDAEANGLLETVDKIWCVVFKDIKTKEVFKFHVGSKDWATDCMAFMDGCDALIGHNVIGYDFPLFEKVWGYEYKGKKVDTLLISRLHNPDRLRPRGYEGKGGPHSVEAWGYRLGRWKPEHEDWTQFSDEMLHRCSEDVEIQYKVMLALHDEGKKYNWSKAYDLTFKLFEVLQKQYDYGWLMDRPYVDRCIRQLTTWIGRIDRAVTPHLPMVLEIGETKKAGEYGWIKKPFLKSRAYSANVLKWFDTTDYNPEDKVVGGPFSRVTFRRTNLNSGDEMKEFLLDAGWIPKEWNYKKDPITKRPMKDEDGKLIRTSPKLGQDDPFEGVNGTVGKLCAKRIQVRHRRSNIEGWVKNLRADGRLGGGIGGIATTGRMKHRGIVNVPGAGAFYGKQMRRCFIADEGKVLVSVDADACQNRMLGQRANSPELTEILLGDSHTLVMNAVNSVLSQYGLPLISRGKAKGFGFAYRFGASDNKLGEMAGRNSLGAEIRDAINAVFPNQAELLERLTKEWRSNAKKRMNDWGKMEYYDGWITGLDGRPIHIKQEHTILVFMLQSDEAIFMSAAYCIAYKKLCAKYKWGEQFGITLFYHDEFTVECDKGIAEDVKLIMEESLSISSNYYKMFVVPQTGTADVGHNWLEVH